MKYVSIPLWALLRMSTTILLYFSSFIEAKQILSIFIHGTEFADIRPYLCKSDCLLPEQGLTPIQPQEVLGGPLRHYAAYHILNAFHECAAPLDAEQPMPIKRHLYIFGWTGSLDESARRDAAHALYTALQNEYEARWMDDPDIEIEFYTHSHGGQVALHLAELWEVHRKKIEWRVNRAIFSAMPLYYNTARYLLSPMFQQIINIYSEGDMVQKLDFISVPIGSCKRRINDIHQLFPLPPGHPTSLTDVRLTGHENYHFFGHHAFFSLDRYTNTPPSLSRTQRQNYRDLANHLTPLPLVTLYPLLLPHIPKESGYRSFDLNITHKKHEHIEPTEKELHLILYDQPNKRLLSSIKVPNRFFKVQATTIAAYANTQHPSEGEKFCWWVAKMLSKIEVKKREH